MGYASIAATNLCLHRLGTSADVSALARLNAPVEMTGGLVEPSMFWLEKAEAL